jgi:hypothetical protein
VVEVHRRASRRVGVAHDDLQPFNVQRGAAATVLQEHAVPVIAVALIDERSQGVEAVGKGVAFPTQRAGFLECYSEALALASVVLEGEFPRKGTVCGLFRHVQDDHRFQRVVLRRALLHVRLQGSDRGDGRNRLGAGGALPGTVDIGMDGHWCSSPNGLVLATLNDRR